MRHFPCDRNTPAISHAIPEEKVFSRKKQRNTKDKNAASLMHRVSIIIPPRNFQNENAVANAAHHCGIARLKSFISP
jgi:hypothetical protein